MKRGANYVLLTRLDVELGRVSNIIFTFKGIASKIQKSYPEEVTVDGDLFAIKLFQEDTVKFSGEVLLEAQINYTDGAVAKSNITSVFFDRTLNTEIVEGNEPTGTDAEVHFSVVGNVIIGKIIGEVDPEVIEAAVKDYLDKHPIPTYDDSEIREEIRQVAESIPAPYDDTDIKKTLTDVNSSLSEKQDKLTAGANITISGNVISASGGGSGTTDYSALSNKPKINNVELSGNKTLSQLGINNLSTSDVDSRVQTYWNAHKSELKGDKGDKGNDGTNGSDYVITSADYDAIADVVLTKLPSAESEEF